MTLRITEADLERRQETVARQEGLSFRADARAYTGVSQTLNELGDAVGDVAQTVDEIAVRRIKAREAKRSFDDSRAVLVENTRLREENRGTNADTVVEQTQQFVAKRKDKALADVKDKRERQSIEEWYRREAESQLRADSAWAKRELSVATEAARRGQIAQSTDDAVRSALMGDYSRIPLAQTMAEDILTTQAVDEGWAAETLQAEIASATNGIYDGSALALVSQDVDEAQAFLNRFSDEMSPEGITRVQSQIRAEMQRREAEAARRREAAQRAAQLRAEQAREYERFNFVQNLPLGDGTEAESAIFERYGNDPIAYMDAVNMYDNFAARADRSLKRRTTEEFEAQSLAIESGALYSQLDPDVLAVLTSEQRSRLRSLADKRQGVASAVQSADLAVHVKALRNDIVALAAVAPDRAKERLEGEDGVLLRALMSPEDQQVMQAEIERAAALSSRRDFAPKLEQRVRYLAAARGMGERGIDELVKLAKEQAVYFMGTPSGEIKSADLDAYMTVLFGEIEQPDAPAVPVLGSLTPLVGDAFGQRPREPVPGARLLRGTVDELIETGRLRELAESPEHARLGEILAEYDAGRDVDNAPQLADIRRVQTELMTYLAHMADPERSNVTVFEDAEAAELIDSVTVSSELLRDRILRDMQ